MAIAEIGDKLAYLITSNTGVTVDKLLPRVHVGWGRGDGFNENGALIGLGVGILIGVVAQVIAEGGRNAKRSEIWQNLLIFGGLGFGAGGLLGEL